MYRSILKKKCRNKRGSSTPDPRLPACHDSATEKIYAQHLSRHYGIDPILVGLLGLPWKKEKERKIGYEEDLWKYCLARGDWDRDRDRGSFTFLEGKGMWLLFRKGKG
jgi:hypothetical protein